MYSCTLLVSPHDTLKYKRENTAKNEEFNGAICRRKTVRTTKRNWNETV